MRILVTGGAGYIGSTLVPSLLSDGHYVTVVDDLRLGGHGILGFYSHPRFNLVKESVVRPKVMEWACQKQEAVIHLAALVGEPPCTKWPDEARFVNTYGVECMVEAARKSGVSHFLFSSTCSNYGKRPGADLDESAELVPLSLYAETKIAAEKIVLDANSDSLTTTVFRFATVYGVSPRMRFDTMLNEFVRDAVVDKWLLIYGRESYRTLCHIRDIVQMIKLTLAKRSAAGGEVFNVGDAHISKQGLAEMIVDHVPGLSIDYKDQQSDPRDYRASFEKAVAFGYRPQYTVKDGVREVARALQLGLFRDPHSSIYRNVQ